VIEETIGQQTELQPLYPTGAILTGTAIFRHGAAPLSIIFDQPSLTSFATVDIANENRMISAEFQRYIQTITANPWLQQFPMRLDAVLPVFDDPGWHLRDADGFILPLHSDFAVGWQLLAQGGGQPVTLVGEWDGTYFNPLTTIVGGNCIDLHVVRGIK
jgi:hypothetical protein